MGCHHFNVDVSRENPNFVYLHELYDDRAAFDVHLQSAHFISFNENIRDYGADKRLRFLQRVAEETQHVFAGGASVYLRLAYLEKRDTMRHRFPHGGIMP